MRLIDADEFFNTFPELAIEPYINTPTVEAEERKTGEWLRTEAWPHRIYCSTCFATFIRNDEFLSLGDIPHNYCPSCGAKMGEVKDVQNKTS